MEYNSSLPIYLQAANSIKQDIVTGKLSPGARLPSVRDLAVEYTINPNTVSRVYKELEMEGVCITRRGMGTYVTEDPQIEQQLKEAAWLFQSSGNRISGERTVGMTRSV